MRKIIYTIVISVFVIGCLSVAYSLILESKNNDIKWLKAETNILFNKAKNGINYLKERDTLDQENKILKNNLIKTLLSKKYWFVIDSKTLSSEPKGQGVIIALPEELKEIKYSNSKNGFQKPETGTKVQFEKSFSDEDVGNKLFNGDIIYNYIY